MRYLKAKEIVNINYNRTEIEGCTNWNGLYGFGFHNKPKHQWSVGSVSPPTYRGKNETTRSDRVETRPDYSET